MAKGKHLQPKGLLLLQADHQVGRLPFPKPGSNENGGDQGSRVPTPSDRSCHLGAAWKKQNASEEGLSVPASRQLHPAAPNAHGGCQSSAPCETRSCLTPPSPRRTSRADKNVLLSGCACTQHSQAPGHLGIKN